MKIGIKYQNDNHEYIFNSLNEINNYDEVIYIDYYYNDSYFIKLSKLPELPNSLQKLYCDNNKFIKKLKYLNEFIYF